MFIPQAVGVPGMSGEAPNWWDDTASKPRSFNNSFEDPRWNGATRREYQYGTTTDAAFRAVYMEEGAGKRSLYLQWHVLTDPSADGETDAVFVGFQGLQPGAPQYIFQLVAYSTFPGAITAQPLDAVKTASYTRTAATGVANPLTGGNPLWLTEAARAWLVLHPAPTPDPTTYEWMISIRVPIISTSNIDAGSAAAGGGINLGNSFKFFYAIAVDQGAPVGVWSAYWPREENVPQIAITLAGSDNNYPDPQHWDTVQFGTGGGGVSLDPADVGVKDPVTGLLKNEIKVSLTNPTPVNKMIARPHNGTPDQIPANAITASFRTANWGSQVPWSWQTATGATAWAEIVAGTPPSNGNPIPAGQKGEIEYSWQLTTSQAAAYIGPNATKMTHQCTLVTLSAPGTNIDFVQDSLYKNMDFATTSAFNRIVDINLKGLAAPRVPIPMVTARDVFIFVNVRNLPRTTPPGRPQRPLDLMRIFREGEPLGRDHIEGLIEAREAAGEEIPGVGIDRLRARFEDGGVLGPRIPLHRLEPGTDRPGPSVPPLPPTIDDLLEHLPNVRYSAFYSTGKKIKVGGKIRPVINRLTSFGYVIEHKRPVHGWNFSLGGAFIKVQPNVYKIAVQPGTAKLISTRIVGHEVAIPAKRLPEIVAGPPGRIQQNIPIAKNLPAIGSVATRLTTVFRRTPQ